VCSPAELRAHPGPWHLGRCPKACQGVRAAGLPHLAEQLLRVARPAQAQNDEMGAVLPPEALLELSAAPMPGAPGPADRMARPQHMQPSFAVAGPHFRAQQCPDERAADHPIHYDRTLVIERYQMRCPAPDKVANQTVTSIENPGVDSDGEGNPSNEFIRVGSRQVAPAGPPIQRVEFDVGEGELGCEHLGQRRFSRPRRADDSNPHGSAGPAQGLGSSDNASMTAAGASCGRKCPATGTTRR
jgi:hypothetical protein